MKHAIELLRAGILETVEFQRKADEARKLFAANHRLSEDTAAFKIKVMASIYVRDRAAERLEDYAAAIAALEEGKESLKLALENPKAAEYVDEAKRAVGFLDGTAQDWLEGRPGFYRGPHEIAAMLRECSKAITNLVSLFEKKNETGDRTTGAGTDQGPARADGAAARSG